MTIDEAIEFERQQAKDKRNEHYTFGIQKSKEVAEEHDQIVDWLEELKALKNGLNIKCDNLNEALEKGKKIGYNKALYDFVNACKEDISCQTFGLHINGIERIAEQLKEMEDK